MYDNKKESIDLRVRRNRKKFLKKKPMIDLVLALIVAILGLSVLLLYVYFKN